MREHERACVVGPQTCLQIGYRLLWRRDSGPCQGVFIITSDFTAQAREFGDRVGLELIALPQLQELIREYGPRTDSVCEVRGVSDRV